MPKRLPYAHAWNATGSVRGHYLAHRILKTCLRIQPKAAYPLENIKAGDDQKKQRCPPRGQSIRRLAKYSYETMAPTRSHE